MQQCMVGWNVAATQLVAERVLHQKIGAADYPISANYIDVKSTMMNMLNAGMCVAFAELSSDYVLWYVYASFMMGYASCYAYCLSF